MDHRPLSPWAYFGLQILYNIPLIGFIFLIIHSINGAGNINRRNFARSYWCIFVVYAVVIAVLVATGSGLLIFNAVRGAL